MNAQQLNSALPTEVEPNDALVVGSVELPLVAALLVEQAKAKGHEKQLKEYGFASFEFDKLPFIIKLLRHVA